jgi:hypothetical protein
MLGQPRQTVRQRDRCLRPEGSVATCRRCVGWVNTVNDYWFVTRRGGESPLITSAKPHSYQIALLLDLLDFNC